MGGITHWLQLRLLQYRMWCMSWVDISCLLTTYWNRNTVVKQQHLCEPLFAPSLSVGFFFHLESEIGSCIACPPITKFFSCQFSRAADHWTIKPLISTVVWERVFRQGYSRPWAEPTLSLPLNGCCELAIPGQRWHWLALCRQSR